MSSSKSTSLTKPQKKGSPYVKYYLVAYNVLSALGWGYVLLMTLVHLFNLDDASSSFSSTTPKTTSSGFSRFFVTLEEHLPGVLIPVYRRAGTTFARVGFVTSFVQTCALLEVVHVFAGLVRSSLSTTFMQVYSRLFIVWAITEWYPEAQTNPLYASMVFAWSTTEIIRYTFYALSLLSKECSFVTYLRYTTFYALYPIGASSEAFLIYATLPHSPLTPPFHSWDQLIWDYVRGGNFVIWWPCLYILYTHMIVQRRKVLRSDASQSKPKDVKFQQ